MPSFHVHYSDGRGCMLSGVWFQAPDMVTARRLAVRSAGEFIADAMSQGDPELSFTLHLDDDQEHHLETMLVTARIITVSKPNNDTA